MIKSKILFLLCLAIICHVVVNAVAIKSIDLKSWTEHVINASDSYTTYPTRSNLWNFKSPNHDERKHFLSLHLTEPAFIKVYNYGPGGSKVDIYNYHQKIGEAGSYNLTTSGNNNVGRAYLPKGNHSLSLRPYYKGDSLSMHFVKVHILPKPPTGILKKREPVFNNANKYTPEHNAYVQWDDDSVPNSHQDDDDDDDDDDEADYEDNDEDDEYDDDDDDDDKKDDKDEKWDNSYHKDAGMDGHWWKWYKKGGWKMGRRNKKVIYVSTVNYSEPKTPEPVTVTSTLTVDHTSTMPEPPTPSPREIMVTETVMKTGPTETVQKPAVTETVIKAGPTETTTVTINGNPAAVIGTTVILPVMMNTVTEYKDSRDIPDIPNVEFNRIVTITAEGDITTISASPVTISNDPVTVTMNGQITTVFPEAVTITNEPITVTNEPKTVVSTVNANVTHFLFRQTIMQTVYQTNTALVTRTFTDHNSILQTIIGGTSTKTENVVVTVYRSRTTSTPTPSPTPP